MVDNVVSTVSDEEEDIELSKYPKIEGYLNKWTNYLYGWQKRWIVLQDGALSYYKSHNEISCGCRGAISLYKAYIKVNEICCTSFLNFSGFVPMCYCIRVYGFGL